MDVSDAGYYIFNDKGNKGSQMGHTKKIFKKRISAEPHQAHKNFCGTPLLSIRVVLRLFLHDCCHFNAC
jgi:hypothetical protein